jgi:hypothetical protein
MIAIRKQKPQSEWRSAVQINTTRRAAVVVLTALLLAAAGQGAAVAADPQWESAPLAAVRR